jgi:hypothetical protein
MATLRKKPVYWIPTLTALAGAAVLIYWTSTARPLWVDEEMLLLNVRDRAFSELAGPLWLDQSAPLGWLAMERLALLMLGTGERAVRLLTVIFGTATLLTGAWIGRRWMSPFGATVLVLLCAIGEWLVFFTLELKHYSADTFFALLLPALGAWALESSEGIWVRSSGSTAVDDDPGFMRRVAVWWVVAALGQWFSNGALFVAPLCAVALCIEAWRRRGWRVASWTALAGCVWLASFALNYWLVLRHALGNTYLRNYWAFAFPPVSGAVDETLKALVAQFQSFALKPGGSSATALFWVAAVGGYAFAIATRRSLGIMAATVPLSAAALAVFHIVPIFERLSLWVVPALYLAIGLCADAAVWLASSQGRQWGARKRIAGLALAVAPGVAAILVCVNVVQRGEGALESRPQSNYGLDDRSSVRSLLAIHRPGDVVMTTHYGLAAIWWYGGLNVAGPDRGSALPDGSPIFEIGHVPPGRDCARWHDQMNAVLSGRARVVVYLGFRLNVEPPGFDNFVLQELGKRGGLVSYKQYAEDSRLAVFDLGRAPSETLVVPGEAGALAVQDPLTVTGCLAVKPARRW